jgi:nucleotide-binding universal stress UspA family protein
LFEKILVPLDGSTTAEMVIPYVIDFGWHFGARITLIRIGESEKMVPDYRGYLEKITAGIVQTIRKTEDKKQFDIEISVPPVSGNTGDSILKAAREINSDMIILASRGASNQGIWPLGHITSGILRGASCPVLLIRKKTDGIETEKGNLIKKVLVPLDGSELSEMALPFAERIAREMRSQLVLFRAIEPRDRPGVTGALKTDRPEVNNGNGQERDGAASAIGRYLGNIRLSLEAKRINAMMAIQEGRAAEEILEYANLNRIDLIVMSTHGRSGIGRWAFGGNTDKVLHAGETPVLVVYP